MRELIGTAASDASRGFIYDESSLSGIFEMGMSRQNFFQGTTNYAMHDLKLRASRVAPVGPEVQPMHFSTRLWRRVS